MAFAYHSLSIKLYIPALPLSCTKWHVGVTRGLPTWPWPNTFICQCPMWPPSIVCILQTFSNILCGMAAFSNAYIYQLGHIGSLLLQSSLASTKISQCQAWTSRIVLVLHTTVSQCQAFPAHISFVLHTMVTKRRMWPARTTFGLNTMVSRCQTLSSFFALGLHAIVCWHPNVSCQHCPYPTQIHLLTLDVPYKHCM